MSARSKRCDELEQKETDTKVQSEKLRSDLAMITAERDSLVAMLAQKDSLLQLQAQQSDISIKMLQQRQEALERADDNPHHSAKARQLAEYAVLQESISSLFEEEEEEEVRMDVKKLIAKVRDLRGIIEEGKAAKAALSKISSEKQALEQQVDGIKQLAVAGAKKEAEMRSQIDRLEEELKTAKATASDMSSALKGQQKHVDRLNETLDRVREANAGLLKKASESQAGQQDKDTMQRELQSLWQSVQELNKLDALKDRSIQDLLAEKDRAVVDRDQALEKLQKLTRDYTELQEELQVKPTCPLPHILSQSFQLFLTSARGLGASLACWLYILSISVLLRLCSFQEIDRDLLAAAQGAGASPYAGVGWGMFLEYS